MALEARQIYRVLTDENGLVRGEEFNRQLQYIADRLDRLESLRDTARHYGDLQVDGNIRCDGDFSVDGEATLPNVILTTVTAEDITTTTIIVNETADVLELLTTLDQLSTGNTTVQSLLINDDYTFASDWQPPEQTASFYAGVNLTGNLDVGGDIATASDAHIGGDVSLSGALTSNQLTTGDTVVRAMRIDDDYAFPTEWAPPEQSGSLYSGLQMTGNLDVGGDIATASDAHIGGDVSLSGSLTAANGVLMSIVISSSTPYTVQPSDVFILANAFAGNMTIDLYTAGENIGKNVIVKKVDATANTVTIDGFGAETIDDAATITLTAQYDVLHIVPITVGGWVIIHQTGGP